MVATSRMKHYHATPIHVLARGKVRYVGEPIVAVLGDSRYLAEDALEHIEIAFEPLGDVIDHEAAIHQNAPLLHEDIGTNVLLSREFSRGAVDAVMASTPVRVGGRFRIHRKTPAAMEPRTYVAEYDRGRNILTLISSTHVPGIVRDAPVALLDMPGHSVRVVARDVGGGFGGKTSVYPEEVLVCALARRLRRAVRWTSDRLEDPLATSQAFDELVDAELGVDCDGNIMALRADVIGDVGAYSIYPWTAGIEPVQVVSFLPGPYRIDPTAGACERSRPRRRPWGLIGASVVRSRPLSWNG
jgi:aerobic carbon-monoxide dehydrogenase large subunit